jgi:hypothetical protein
MGTATTATTAADHNARTFNYTAGDVGFAPFAMVHYVHNTSVFIDNNNAILWIKTEGVEVRTQSKPSVIYCYTTCILLQ